MIDFKFEEVDNETRLERMNEAIKNFKAQIHRLKEIQGIYKNTKVSDYLQKDIVELEDYKSRLNELRNELQKEIQVKKEQVQIREEAIAVVKPETKPVSTHLTLKYKIEEAEKEGKKLDKITNGHIMEAIKSQHDLLDSIEKKSISKKMSFMISAGASAIFFVLGLFLGQFLP